MFKHYAHVLFFVEAAWRLTYIYLLSQEAMQCSDRANGRRVERMEKYGIVCMLLG